ncbi:MAG TPA: GNAT family N-acetyltransferase [Kofleriaceae bacterium]|jgi:RimJ/RimL family protein N-acetyltransferase
MGDDRVIRVLVPADDAAMRAFLTPRAATSMFLLSNSLAAGLVDEGKPLHATYAGAFEAGELVGVVAHCWNGMVLVQAPPELLHELARFAVAQSRRAIAGFSGPSDQVAIARGAFELPPASVDELESLYSLALADLHIPAALARGDVTCRHPSASELPLLAAWRGAYHVESLGAVDNDELATRAAREIDQLAARSHVWVLEHAGEVVALTGFNAYIPGMAQVGGVYTPPASRGRGYARCAVAGSLLDARDRGDTRAILFTPNPAAARAYEAIGFRRIGDYALVMI